MQRRTFVHALGASLATGPWASRVTGSPRRLNRIGLELYSVRDAMGRDPDGTLAAVRAMGYTDVELLWSFGNFGRTTEQVRAALDHEGLRAPSAHVSPTVVLVGWREWADRFNAAGAAARRAGIWLAFHNEADHMTPIDGTVPYDVFVQRTDSTVVRHQLDVGNMIMGGGDPFAYLERYRDRYWSFHLKDVVKDRSRDTELGTGTVDFRRLLANIPDIDNKPCYVEEEGVEHPLDNARRNCAFLKTLEF